MWTLKVVALLMGAVVSFASVARERSLSFEHKDWMLSCDNTATRVIAA